MFITAVYLLDIVDAACALGAHGCYQQGDTGSDIRTRHATASERDLTVVTNDNCTVGIAEDNLCTHVDQLVDKEQAALEHLLVEQHTAPCLSSHDNQYRKQVGCQSWPGGIGECHDGAVDK